MDQLRVKGCLLCDIFLNNDTKVKLYWPESHNDIKESEFIIIDCPNCKIPTVIFGEHVTTIPRESWGRILYRCKRIFGGGITLKCKPCKIFDHHHCHILNVKRY